MNEYEIRKMLNEIYSLKINFKFSFHEFPSCHLLHAYTEFTMTVYHVKHKKIYQRVCDLQTFKNKTKN